MTARSAHHLARWGWAAAAGLAALYGVALVHAAGQALLAVVLLVLAALALVTYTSRRTHALRYLFPGIAAALVFVVFPMLYTVGLSFSNRSSDHLLEHDAARAQLLDESVVTPDSQRAFEPLAQAGGRVRLWLPAHADQPPLATDAVALDAAGAAPLPLHAAEAPPTGTPWTLAQRVQALPALRALRLTRPDGRTLQPVSLREVGERVPLYEAQGDGSLRERLGGTVYRRDDTRGQYVAADGEGLQPGYVVNVGLAHYARIATDAAFRAPFVAVFVWTVAFAALSVAGAAALGLLLASLFNWPDLKGKGAYRLVLFLPYAVPGFISILVFKGLFNQNLGEVNLILNALFGVRPAWFSDPTLARLMLLLVNVWLGFPYMMVLCAGLIQSIPADLYEASAVEGAGAWTNFRRITLPLIVRPLTPLLIAAFAFNFNNFVLVSLLTGGRPDQVGSTLPAGTTDVLVSYTWRIAFQDGGQQFGLAAAISTVIFLIVAAITLVQMRATRAAEGSGRKA